jgi:hypothetical protein
MENHSRTQSAQYEAGSRNPDGTYAISTGFANDFTEIFNVSVNVRNGNRKDPNPHEYQRYYRRYYNGLETNEASGQLIAYRQGALGRQLTPSRDYSGFSSNVYNEALSKVYERLRSSADLSVDIGQMGQTQSMIRNAVRSVTYFRRYKTEILREWYRDFLDVRNRVRRNPLYPAKSLGSKWLEFQYGWKPLAQDIYDSAVALQKALPSKMKIKERAQQVDHERISQTSASYGDGFIETSNWNDSSRCQFEVSYYPPTSGLAFLANFTSLNPVSIAWELIPYSFVVDWFIDIGGYMRNLENACLYGSAFQGGTVTETRRILGEGSIRGSNNGYTVQANDGIWLNVYKRRQVLVSNPLPRVPQFTGVNLGSGRLLNAAALLSQHLKS